MDSKIAMPFAVPPPEPEVKVDGTDLKVTQAQSSDGTAVITRVEASPNTVIADPNRPDYLPEKFKDVAELKISTLELLKDEPGLKKHIESLDSVKDAEAIAAIYKAYESDLGKPKVDPNETPEAKVIREAKEAADAAAVAPAPKTAEMQASDLVTYGPVVGKVLNDAGVDGLVLGQEYAKDGKLSDARYAALEKAGFSKQIVDTFLTGSVGLGNKVADQQISAIKESVGGQEAFTKIAQWAATGLNAEEQAEYNAAVSSGNQRLVNKAVAGLKASYDTANGSAPKLVGDGGNTPAPTRAAASSLPAFRSWQEVTAAMQDPRYTSNDPAYHADVDARLANSTL